MAFFPLYIEMEQRPGLLVGGGQVALRKAEKLLPYGPLLEVVSPEFDPELEELAKNSDGRLLLTKRRFEFADLTKPSFVIACTDDEELNHKIAAVCRERNLPVNVVDDPPACSFFFPALLKRGPLSVGISTGGSSPLAAIWLKERLDELLPARMEEIVLQMESLRQPAKEKLPHQPDRAAFLRHCFNQAMSLERPLSTEELETAWSQAIQKCHKGD